MTIAERERLEEAYWKARRAQAGLEQPGSLGVDELHRPAVCWSDEGETPWLRRKPS
jgi:hypothetical protein